MHAILVAGGRNYDNEETIHSFLDPKASLNFDDIIVITGKCKFGGADLIAEEWANDNEVPHLGWPAPFSRMGKFGGPYRNEKMTKFALASFSSVEALAFPMGISNGTRGFMRWCVMLGIPLDGQEYDGSKLTIPNVGRLDSI